MQSDVVIVGYRLNAKEPAQKALERILGLSPETARVLARSFPAVVVEGAANDNAERIRAQLADAGALVELRASGRQFAPAPRDLPAPPRSPAKKADMFALDLEPGSLPPSGPKTGTGPNPFQGAKTGTGPLPIPSPPRSTQQTRGGPARAPQPTSRGLRASMPQQPPPPPAAAYQLGDFGLGPRGQSVVAKLPLGPPSLAPASLAPAPQVMPQGLPTLADGDFDMEGGGFELELGLGAPRALPLALDSSPAANIEVDMLGERFEELASPRPSLNGQARPVERMPDVEPAAFRAIQRGRVDSRRPVKKQNSLLERALESPLPSLLMLLVLSAISLAAVGFALNPDDPVAGLASAQAMAESDAPDQIGHRDGYLHPLLRSTPRPVRAPLAAILRARISGVHDVTVSFRSGDMTAQCTLVEHSAETEARLARVRETGHEVPASNEAALQLIEHERALRAQLGRPDLLFTRVCLVP